MGPYGARTQELLGWRRAAAIYWTELERDGRYATAESSWTEFRNRFLTTNHLKPKGSFTTLPSETLVINEMLQMIIMTNCVNISLRCTHIFSNDVMLAINCPFVVGH
jgi:hypothetical protein